MINENGGILIAIDGPSGSGKSTISKRVALELGIGYLDTGAMYRALTWLCLRDGVELDDQFAVRDKANSLAMTMKADPIAPRFFVQESDVTADLRTVAVAENVSTVARNLAVRKWMAEEQRRIMLAARNNGNGMVAEGRDTTTVVCPEADVRILLLADQDARLHRRTLELHGEVTAKTLAATEKQIIERDRSDATVSEFYTAAPGVTTIDSSGKSIEEVIGLVLDLLPQ